MTEFVLAEGKWRRIFYSRAELLRFLALCTVSRECRASVKEAEPCVKTIRTLKTSTRLRLN